MAIGITTLESTTTTIASGTTSTAMTDGTITVEGTTMARGPTVHWTTPANSRVSLRGAPLGSA